jgi:hypothetical protein
MRPDVRALLKLLGASFLVAVVIMAVLAASAVGLLARDAAVYSALGIFLVGAAFLARRFSAGLLLPPPRGEESAEPDEPPD